MLYCQLLYAYDSDHALKGVGVSGVSDIYGVFDDVGGRGVEGRTELVRLACSFGGQEALTMGGRSECEGVST